MIRKFLLLVVILFFSFGVSCNSLIFKRIPGKQGYIVSGRVDPNMLEYSNTSTWGNFYVNVHETGESYYTYISNSEYCPDNAIGAAAFMNKKLSMGVSATTAQVYSDNKLNWTAKIFCMSRPGKTWTTATTVSSPPGSAECSIIYPEYVLFGYVTLGTVKDINSDIRISCNASANVKVSISKSTVKLGDAEVNYYFPGNKKTHNVSVGVNSPANFNVRFSLEKTGNTLGYKTGDAVMIFNWQ